MNQPPPPPPPPHGHHQQQSGRTTSSGLPNGNYDIFIIPPHSAGGGFVYLPSLQPQRNSFLAGAACTGVLVILYQVVLPVFRSWFASMVATGGAGVILLVMSVGLAGWAWGKGQAPDFFGPDAGNSSSEGGPNKSHANGGAYPNGDAGGGSPQDHHHHHDQNGAPPPPHSHAPNGGPPPPHFGSPPDSGAPPRPKPTWQRTYPSTTAGSTTGSTSGAAPRTTWEQRKEETRRRQEEQRAQEAKQEAERRAKEAAENLRKEHARTREREAREREARDREAKEKEAQERDAREAREKEVRQAREAREREIRERREKEARERRDKEDKQSNASPPKRHQQPSARTYMGSDEETHSFRPYDKPKRHVPKQESHSSFYSESSYAASHSTARTTPPPSQRGRYTTADPDKIVIKAVYSFSNAFMKVPTAQLVSGVGSVTDGLILRITTEGLFIDDDVRSVPQREWDIKAWTMKLVETGELKGLHVLRASIRDQDGKKYFFVLDESEGWKVAIGLQRLRKGSQVRALGVTSIGVQEAKGLLMNLGWVL